MPSPAVTGFLTNVVLPLLLGVVSSFLVVFFVESKKRPRLVLTAEDPQNASYDPSAPARHGTFVCVIVSNQRLPWGFQWLNRESAISCRAEIQFSSVDGVDFTPMQGRWKSLPEPVPSFGMLGDVQFNIWNPNIWQLAGSGMDIPAGEKEKLDIAIRFDDEQDAFGWSNASYQPPTLWRNPKWKLGKGRYVVTVTVRAGGQKWTDTFELNNDGRRDELRLTRKT